jgi:uncharacterized low-complexity protein
MAARMAFAATSSNGAAAGFIMRSHSRHASGLWSSASRSREGHAGGGPCTGPKSIRTPGSGEGKNFSRKEGEQDAKVRICAEGEQGSQERKYNPKKQRQPRQISVERGSGEAATLQGMTPRPR